MIDYIKIKNFKSIKDAETKLPIFGALVGSNAAGKTNFIQAIELTRDLIMGASTEEALNKIVLTPFDIFNFNEISKQVSISILIGDNQNDKYFFTYTLGLENSDTPSLTVQYEKLEKCSDDGNIIIYLREVGRLMNGENNSIPLDIDPKKLVLASYRDQTVVKVKNIFSKVNILQAKALDSRESLVNLTAEGLAAISVRLKYRNAKAYGEFEDIIKNILPSFSTYLIQSFEDRGGVSNETEKYHLVLLEEKNLKGKLSMQSISAGDLRTLYFIASALSMEGGTCLITEEIENGMHPLRVKDVLSYMDHISRQKRVQMLFTTHSPVVINKLRPEDVIYVKKDNDTGTSLTQLGESKEITAIQSVLDKGGQLTDYINSRL